MLITFFPETQSETISMTVIKPQLRAARRAVAKSLLESVEAGKLPNDVRIDLGGIPVGPGFRVGGKVFDLPNEDRQKLIKLAKQMQAKAIKANFSIRSGANDDLKDQAYEGGLRASATELVTDEQASVGISASRSYDPVSVANRARVEEKLDAAFLGAGIRPRTYLDEVADACNALQFGRARQRTDLNGLRDNLLIALASAFLKHTGADQELRTTADKVCDFG